MNTLRFALIGNASFSALTGAILILMPGSVIAWLGTPDGLIPPLTLQIIGAILISFALHLLRAARRKPIHPGEVLYFCIMDAAWVLGSAVLLIFRNPGFSTTGAILITAVAAVVSLWAILQWRGRQSLLDN